MNPLDALRPLPSPPPNMTAGIGGWLTGDEEAVLYALGRTVKGRILEVGPWIGRSTICIASGIRDSGTSKEFTTCELAPTEDHWRPRPDGGRDFRPDPDRGPLGGVSAEEWDMVIGPAITAPGGVVGVLYDNLVQARVINLVNLVVGDFRTAPELAGAYDFIFADNMHNPSEIGRNIEHYRHLLAPGAVFACHDTSPENREALDMEFVDELVIDGLFLGVAAS